MFNYVYVQFSWSLHDVLMHGNDNYVAEFDDLMRVFMGDVGLILWSRFDYFMLMIYDYYAMISCDWIWSWKVIKIVCFMMDYEVWLHGCMIDVMRMRDVDFGACGLIFLQFN